MLLHMSMNFNTFLHYKIDVVKFLIKSIIHWIYADYPILSATKIDRVVDNVWNDSFWLFFRQGYNYRVSVIYKLLITKIHFSGKVLKRNINLIPIFKLNIVLEKVSTGYRITCIKLPINYSILKTLMFCIKSLHKTI